MSIVSSNNESEDPAKKDLGWVRGVFSCANGRKIIKPYNQIKSYIKSPGLNNTSPRFKTMFFTTLPVWVISGRQVCFLFPSLYKNLASEKTFQVC